MRVAEHNPPTEDLRALTHESPRDRRAASRPSSIAMAAALLLLAPLLAPSAQASPLMAPSALTDSLNGSLPPLALTADTTSGDVVLSWQAPAGNADGYRVYRAEDAEAVAENGMDAFVAIGETTALSFVDIVGTGSGEASSDPAFRAIYFVTALLGDGESPPSNPVSVEYPKCWDLFRFTSCFIP